LFTGRGEPLNGGLPTGSTFEARVHFRLEKPIASFEVSLGFNNLLGQRVFTAHSICERERSLGERVGEQVFVCQIPSLTLVPGEYSLKVGLDVHDEEVDAVEDAARLSMAPGDYYGTGKMPRNGLFLLNHRWRLV
jgi:lipopolysaccharide transport system ATP-binding protein